MDIFLISIASLSYGCIFQSENLLFLAVAFVFLLEISGQFYCEIPSSNFFPQGPIWHWLWCTMVNSISWLLARMACCKQIQVPGVIFVKNLIKSFVKVHTDVCFRNKWFPELLHLSTNIKREWSNRSMCNYADLAQYDSWKRWWEIQGH